MGGCLKKRGWNSLTNYAYFLTYFLFTLLDIYHYIYNNYCCISILRLNSPLVQYNFYSVVLLNVRVSTSVRFLVAALYKKVKYENNKLQHITNYAYFLTYFLFILLDIYHYIYNNYCCISILRLNSPLVQYNFYSVVLLNVRVSTSVRFIVAALYKKVKFENNKLQDM